MPASLPVRLGAQRAGIATGTPLARAPSPCDRSSPYRACRLDTPFSAIPHPPRHYRRTAQTHRRSPLSTSEEGDRHSESLNFIKVATK
ncbi:MAG: hypothetical protein KME26_32875 [Oscillatoria princeps RMCB-10]|nr:hypothetical protein [Oscillatoria princeps RMCB-10]